MKDYFHLFLVQLVIIGMATSIRMDIPIWKQLIGYCLVACILPTAIAIEKATTLAAKSAAHKELNEPKTDV